LILPDVHVLLYAFRADVPGHSQHRIWLEQLNPWEALLPGKLVRVYN
jgi:hypothetical protein